MGESATSPLNGLRIFVAEDEVLIAVLLQEILLSLGCTVIGPVATLDEALRAIQANTIDGALLDLNLGRARIDPAASELALRKVPFIIMTGQGSLRGFPALLAGAPLLSKPFKLQQLEDMMIATFRPPAASGGVAPTGGARKAA
jgi:DNA-binding response OmpR family regulator